MNDHASFKIYVDSGSHHKDMDRKGSGVGEPDPNAMNEFTNEVDKIKEDIKNMDKLYSSLVNSNEGMKAASSTKDVMELRAQTSTDLDNVLMMSKQINKKLDGLVVANAIQRKTPENGSGSPNDQARASMMSELIESLMNMMRGFQGLRIRMETDQRQVIENRYFSITGEKATEEAIDKLISNEGHESLLYQAMQEQGSSVVLDTVAEIQERRDAMKEIHKSLLNLHQILSGMAMSVENQGVDNLPNPKELPSRPLLTTNAIGIPVVKVGGAGRLNDYEKETRRQAYIALVLALACSIVIIFFYLKTENAESEVRTSDPTSLQNFKGQ